MRGFDSLSGLLIMKVLKALALITVVGLAISVAVVVYLKYLKPVSNAEISITATPTANVFIDGAAVGKTPFQISRPAGDIVLKLKPEASPSAVMSYETKIGLQAGLKTEVNWELGSSDDLSGGEVVTYEKISGNDSDISLVSTPDYAQVTVDGNIRGFSPVLNYVVAPDEHKITVSKIGYVNSNLIVTTHQGYKTVVVVKLIANGEPQPKADQPLAGTPTPVAKNIFVQILDTPSGFLRVRANGSTTAAEIGRVKPGDQLPFVSQNTAGDWYQVIYNGKNTGWVFSQFAKKLDQTGNPAIENPNNQ